MRAFCAAILVASILTGTAAAEPWCPGSLEVMVVEDWSITPLDERSNELLTVLVSHLDHPIRMIDGSAGFIDALGEEIARFALDRDMSVDIGGRYEQKGLWGRNTFERLLDLRHEEVTTFVCVKAVLFDDGTKKTFETAK